MTHKAYNKILPLLTQLNKAELRQLQSEIGNILPGASEPTAKEKLLAPGEHLEEKRFTNKDGSTLTYVHLRWYERSGQQYSHKSRAVFKGTLSEYLASYLGTD